MQYLKSLLENDKYKFLWDFETEMDHLDKVT